MLNAIFPSRHGTFKWLPKNNPFLPYTGLLDAYDDVVRLGLDITCGLFLMSDLNA